MSPKCPVEKLLAITGNAVYETSQLAGGRTAKTILLHKYYKNNEVKYVVEKIQEKSRDYETKIMRSVAKEKVPHLVTPDVLGEMTTATDYHLFLSYLPQIRQKSIHDQVSIKQFGCAMGRLATNQRLIELVQADVSKERPPGIETVEVAATRIMEGHLSRTDRQSLTWLLSHWEEAVAQYLSRCRYFAHSDVTLRNVHISRESTVLIDWGSVRLAPLGVDLIRLRPEAAGSTEFFEYAVAGMLCGAREVRHLRSEIRYASAMSLLSRLLLSTAKGRTTKLQLKGNATSLVTDVHLLV